nr:hypothetical protein GCM10025732_48730 [Glycomyces mayteni]
MDGQSEAAAFDIDNVVRAHDAAADLARDADVAVVVLGDHPLVNGRETEDRRDLNLPNHQEWLLRRVVEANPNTILVMSSSYPYAANWAAKHVPAVVWSGHGGRSGAARSPTCSSATATPRAACRRPGTPTPPSCP